MAEPEKTQQEIEAEEAGLKLQAVIQRALDEFAGPGMNYVMVYGNAAGTQQVTNLDLQGAFSIIMQMGKQMAEDPELLTPGKVN